jgi:hypothetical protein
MTTSAQPHAQGAAPTSASPELPPGCAPPTEERVVFESGAATLTVKTGPAAGHYSLRISRDGDNQLDTRYDFGYVFQGTWGGGRKPGLDLSIDDPVCDENGFLGITFDRGKVRYADGSHTDCKNTVDSLGPAGVSGSFVCKKLDIFEGTGYPRTVNASGTFILTPS